jgi:hypothetical protein
MTILTNIPNGASAKDVRDTINSLLLNSGVTGASDSVVHKASRVLRSAAGVSMTYPVMANAPTVAFGAANGAVTAVLAGSTAIKPTSIESVNGRMSHITATGTFPAGIYRGDWISSTNNESVYGIGVEYRQRAATFAIRVRDLGVSLIIMARRADGPWQYVSNTPSTIPGAIGTGANFHWVSVTFGAVDDWSVRFLANGPLFQHTDVLQTSSLTPLLPSRNDRPRIFVQGDSYTAATAQIASPVRSIPMAIGERLGCDVHVVGVGGQGLLNAVNSKTFVTQMADFDLLGTTDAFVCLGSVNDYSSTADDLQTATATYMTAALARFPNCPIIFVEPLNAPLATPARVFTTSQRAAIRAGFDSAVGAQKRAKYVTVDPNVLISDKLGADMLHPNDAGGVAAGDAIGLAIRTALASVAA